MQLLVKIRLYTLKKIEEHKIKGRLQLRYSLESKLFELYGLMFKSMFLLFLQHPQTLMDLIYARLRQEECSVILSFCLFCLFLDTSQPPSTSLCRDLKYLLEIRHTILDYPNVVRLFIFRSVTVKISNSSCTQNKKASLTVSY